MPAPIDTESIIRKLLQKTEVGKIEWTADGRTFNCSLDDKFRFEITKKEDIYTIKMQDERWNEIFTESIQEEIFFKNDQTRRKFEMLRDLYEMARRIAFDVDNKLAGVSELLDRI